MKTSSQSATSRTGNTKTRRSSRRAAPASSTARKALRAPTRSTRRARTKTPASNGTDKGVIYAPAAQPPRYDTGLRYDSGVRYVGDDPAPVPAGKAKVKLELQRRTDSNLVGFAHAHVDAITGNASFPTPQPTAAVFDGKLAELEAVLAAMENQRLAAKALTDQRDAIRQEFEVLFNQRGTYVELASGGDYTLITSAGLPVRSQRTPVGVLPAPLALRVDLNGEEGAMLVRWEAVGESRGYLLECAEVINNVAVGWTLKGVTGRNSERLTGMVVGKTYAFRVAAVGGESGRSAWSPEVWRTAA